MYVVGLGGLLMPPLQPYFKLLSAFNLWVSLGILLLFHENYQKSFIVFSIITFFAGFLIEVLGTNTGVVFGQYWYGTTLGFKIANVPIVLGANWLILIYCTGIVIQTIIDKFAGSGYFSVLNTALSKSLLAALLMVGLDIFIEPVAIRLDFWQWNNNIVPLQNYLAWFIISFLLTLYFFSLKSVIKNSIAFLMLLLQFLFFMLHSAFYIFFKF
jgi:putative membrane protein